MAGLLVGEFAAIVPAESGHKKAERILRSADSFFSDQFLASATVAAATATVEATTATGGSTVKSASRSHQHVRRPCHCGPEWKAPRSAPAPV